MFYHSSNNTSQRAVVSISTLTGLVSTLCRNSNTITKEILASNILDAIEKALYGDERCVLDTMRFLDLLLTLIFEGRDALPKSSTQQVARTLTNLSNPVTNTTTQVNSETNNKKTSKQKSSQQQQQQAESKDEKFYRQLIEWIRIKDTEALVEALETNPVDLNFMDDVGQTLLNWAAAFGTAEMVEYLATKGADVNKGQRSSSLHYAACFGRSNVVKILLRHGADPDLRDEEGKTALDKARERGEENHREVVQILQSPCDYVTVCTQLIADDDVDSQQPTLTVPESIETSTTNDESQSNSNLVPESNAPIMPVIADSVLPLIDTNICQLSEIPNMETVKLEYTKRLIPIFCKVFLNCMIQSINKTCLNLLRKLINCASKDQLNLIVQLDFNVNNSLNESMKNQSHQTEETSTISALLVELISKVLQENQNQESVFIGLSISSDLFRKCSPYILEEFTRLGVGHLISQLAMDTQSADDEHQTTQATSEGNERESKKPSLVENVSVVFLKKLLV